MKNLRPIIILSGLLSLAGVIVAGIFLFLGPDRLDPSGRNFWNLLQSGELVGMIVIPIMLVVGFFIFLSVLRTVSPPRIKNGVTAPVRVLEVHDTGVSINDNPQVALLVEVLPKYGSPFQAEVKTMVSRLNAALVQPGITAEVVYDPQKPTRIQVSNLDLKPVDLNDSESRLRELNRLYDGGLITGEEFRAKRADILKKL